MNKTEAREFLSLQARNVWTAIRELSLEELQETKEVADNYSVTNCWFVEYGMKDSFLKLINDRIDEIKAQAKESRRTKL